MNAVKYHELSDAKDVIEIKAGIPLKENVEQPEAFIYLANGKKVDGEYIPEDGDLIVFRSVPGYSGAVMIVFAAIAIAGAAYAGYQAYQMRKQAEEMEKAMRAMNEGVVSTPMLRGATNQSAKDKFLPFIIGRNFFTPYKLVSGWKEIEGQYQEYYNIVLQCGSNQQVLETLSSDDVVIKTFSGDSPQSGTFTLDEASPFYTAEAIGEVVQNGADFTESRFNKCVKMIQTNVEVKKTDESDFEPVILSLPFFAKGVDICLQFDGLRYYTKDGDKRARAVSMKIEESLDGGTTWADASIVDYASSTITISGNTNKQFFKVLKYRKTYSEVKDLTKQILIRITGLTASYDGTALDRVIIPWQTSEIYNPDKSATANNFVDEIIIDTPERAKSTLIGLRIKTTDSNAEKLNKLNIVTNGIARTWNGTEWSVTKSKTANPAAWLLEVLTTSSHPPSQCADSELDLDAFGELYEHCEDEGLTVNFVITEGDTKENILKKICGTCFAAMYRNYAGKISVTFDGVRENAIAVFNTQNVISFKNVKEIGNITDGIRVSYLQADAWDRDSSLVMRPGAIRDGNAIIRDMSIEGVTNYDQAVYIARRIMAQELYRQKNVSVKVGQEGAFYAPLEKVLVQHPSLKIGLGSAEIKAVIVSGDYITGVELYEPVYYDSIDVNGFGMVIQCVSDTYCTPLAKAYTAVSDGYVTEVSFTVPIDTTTAPVVPFAGDVLSYGYLNDGAFDTITSEMLITEIGRADNGYELKLVDYNPDIYVTGSYPEYTPNITQPIAGYIASSVPVTMDEVDTRIEEVQQPISISGIPLFPDRETCIAHCVLDDVHYLLYQDTTVGSENWEIVTVETDGSLTSYRTGAGTARDMCVHNGEIIVVLSGGASTDLEVDGTSAQSDGTYLYSASTTGITRRTSAPYGIYLAGYSSELAFPFMIGADIYCCLYDANGIYKYDGTWIEQGFSTKTFQYPCEYEEDVYILNITDGKIQVFDGSTLVDVVSVFPSNPTKRDVLYSTDDGVYFWEFNQPTVYKINGSSLDVFATIPSLLAFSGVKYRGAHYFVSFASNVGDTSFKLFNNSGDLILETIIESHFVTTNFGLPAFVYNNKIHVGNVVINEDLTSVSVFGGDIATIWDGSTFLSNIYNYPNSNIQKAHAFGKRELIASLSGATFSKMRYFDNTMFICDENSGGNIHKLENVSLEQITFTDSSYTATTWRGGRLYASSGGQLYLINSDGTHTAIENATSPTTIKETFIYNDYLVWCPEYTPPATGRLLAGYIDFTGNINIPDDINTTISSDFPYGVYKTFRKMTSWSGTPVGILPPSGATIEGQSVVWLYDKYDFFTIERVAENLFVIADRNMPTLEISSDFDSLDGLPINSDIVLRKATSGGTITITAPSGTTFEGLGSLTLSAQYAWVQLERISATLFGIRHREVSSGGDGVPVGVPVPVVYPATLSTPFYECNGQMIDDAESIFDDTRLPNLNGANVILTLTFTSDAGGSYATCPLADIPALGLHDWVTGSGIADHTWIADIDYSTGEVILSDTAASGSIVCTFSNEGRGIVGGGFGSVGDQGQRLTGEIIGIGGEHPGTHTPSGVFYKISNGVSRPAYAISDSNSWDDGFDSSLSPYARTSAETWGKTKTDAYKLTYYMRIK